MTIHGIADIRCTPATGLQTFNEAYVSLAKFLTSSYAQSIGIQRIAYNTGSSATGQGYWDDVQVTGNNAWSCYKWLSASVPFYVLMQYTAGSTFGAAPGNPGAANGSTSAQALAFAFAMCTSGGNPWNGTTLNNGEDRKGSVVWVAPGTENLYLWPRDNSLSGTFTSTREDMLAVIFNSGVTSARLQFVCDEDNLFFAGDALLANAYTCLYFGKYVPRSGSSPACPYVALRSSGPTDDPAFSYTTYGSYTTAANANGGIAHPSQPASGTRNVEIHSVANFIASTYAPNGAVGADGVWDEWPIYLAMNDSPTWGYCGYTDFIRYIYGVWTHETNADNTRAFFGNASYLSGKVSVPWSATINPGRYAARDGVMF